MEMFFYVLNQLIFYLLALKNLEHLFTLCWHAGLGFKIDEIVQAWNEMYDAQRWQFGVPSFRLEPLFRRRVPKLHSMLEHF